MAFTDMEKATLREIIDIAEGLMVDVPRWQPWKWPSLVRRLTYFVRTLASVLRDVTDKAESAHEELNRYRRVQYDKLPDQAKAQDRLMAACSLYGASAQLQNMRPHPEHAIIFDIMRRAALEYADSVTDQVRHELLNTTGVTDEELDALTKVVQFNGAEALKGALDDALNELVASRLKS